MFSHEAAHIVPSFVVSPFTSSGRGTPASDIPKDEEMIDLISDEEDSPTPTVDKSLPPPDKSQLDQPEDLTVQSSHPPGKPQSTPSLVAPQLPIGVAASPLGLPGSVPVSTIHWQGTGVSIQGPSVAKRPVAASLSVPNAALTELAGTINQWGSSVSRLNDAMAINSNAWSTLTTTLEDWTKSIGSLSSTLSKRNESSDLPQLGNPGSQATSENSRPPSRLR